MKYWEHDESIASQGERLEIRGPKPAKSADNLEEVITDPTIDPQSTSTSTSTGTADAYPLGDIGIESQASCLTSDNERLHLILCPRCFSPSFKPEFWYDGPEGTTSLGRCSKCSSTWRNEAPPSFDDLAGSRLYFEEPSLMGQNTMMIV
jgi:hypothetical protein